MNFPFKCVDPLLGVWQYLPHLGRVVLELLWSKVLSWDEVDNTKVRNFILLGIATDFIEKLTENN